MSAEIQILPAMVFWQDAPKTQEGGVVTFVVISHRTMKEGKRNKDALNKILPENLVNRFWYRSWGGAINHFIVHIEGEKHHRSFWIDDKNIPGALRSYIERPH